MRASLAITVAVFALYAAGACPTIYVGDSGELVTAVDRLGIPHPTGYPLYVLVGKAWTLALPWGSIAWRMSLFSAACAAAAVGAAYAVGRRLGASPVAAATGALLLAASPSFWGEANVQRVYALNALFVVAVTYVALGWRASVDRAGGFRVGLAFFLCGLGASNHTFMAVYGAVLAGWMAMVGGRSVLRPSVVAAAAGGFGLGLLPYAYLPLRSRWDPVIDWGNPETASNFLTVVTRRNFWSRAWVEAPADLWPVVRDYVVSFGTELGWAGCALAAVGVAVGRRRVPLALFALLMLANLAAVAAHGSRADVFVWHRYYVPSYLLAAVVAGVGVDALVATLPRLLQAAPLALPLVALVARAPDLDRSRYRIADHFGAAVLDALPPGAHLAATDDNVLFSLMYLHFVEGRRPDVNLVLQGIGGPPPPALRFDPDGERLFFTHHPNWDVPGLAIVPVGLVFEARRPGARPSLLAMPARLDGEDDPRVPKDHLTQNLLGHFHYMRGVTLETVDAAAARRELARAAEVAPDNDVLFYNLALVHRRGGRLADALAAARRAEALNPRALQSPSRVRPADLVIELQAAATPARAAP